MNILKYRRELYSKVSLIKAAYNFTDRAYLHLDADSDYYYVTIIPKDGCEGVSDSEFENEILTQSVRHEVYLQTRDIRELMLARAMATSVVAPEESYKEDTGEQNDFTEDGILKDWFDKK